MNHVSFKDNHLEVCCRFDGDRKESKGVFQRHWNTVSGTRIVVKGEIKPKTKRTEKQTGTPKSQTCVSEIE